MALAALPTNLRAAGERLPIGFSTLGCPSWDWLKILDFAQQNGFAAVELREGRSIVPCIPRSSTAAKPFCWAKSRISSQSQDGQPSVEKPSAKPPPATRTAPGTHAR